MLDLATLPVEAKRFIEAKIEEHQSEIRDYRQQIEFLQEALCLARRQKFAVRSEKYPGLQSELFNEAEVLAPKPATGEEKSISIPGHTRLQPKRKPLPDDLPRIEVLIDLPEAEKICVKDGSPLKAIGADVSEKAEYVPAKATVIRTIRPKYLCPCCQDPVIKIAPMPECILPKSNAASGLLAFIATSKYVDALPLYRLEKIFKRMKIDLPRNTMASWMIKISEKLTPLYNLMEEDLINSAYVCCDETRVQVLKEPGKKPESLSYMWVRTRHGPNINPIVLFDYEPTRSGKVPKKLLEGFAGYLQVDGYAGYDEVCQNNNITRVACMAHIRRKFFEAYKASSHKDAIAEQAIKIIQGLYQIEEKIRGQDITERHAARQAESVPIMNELQTFLSSNQNRHPPQSLLGKALAYATHQWPHMLNYLKSPIVEIDNNFTENRIRPFAIGRKNWLFSDSVGGAKASAMLYSIIQTACGNGLEPYAYLKYIFTHLPTCKTAEQIEKLLPHKIDFKRLN